MRRALRVTGNAQPRSIISNGESASPETTRPMGTHIQCPSCDRYAADTISPDERWGTIYDDREGDRAYDPDLNSNNEHLERYTFHDRDGRTTFECQCRNAIWIRDRTEAGDRHGPDGRWFTLRGTQTTPYGRLIRSPADVESGRWPHRGIRSRVRRYFSPDGQIWHLQWRVARRSRRPR